eukprot:253342-Pleurochrysis_carterae.AAC.1
MALAQARRGAMCTFERARPGRTAEKVMREASVSERSACTSGTIQMGACRLCKKMGEDSAPRSAGCSMVYSAPAECAARRSWAHDMVAVTDGWWPAISGARSGIEAGHRESGARRGGKDGRVVAVGTALQEALVHRVDKHVVRLAAAFDRTVIHAVRDHAEARQERRNAVGAREGT